MSAAASPADVAAEAQVAARTGAATAAAGAPETGTLEQISETAAAAAAAGPRRGRKRDRAADVGTAGAATEAAAEAPAAGAPAEAAVCRPARRAKLLANAAIHATEVGGRRGRGLRGGSRRRVPEEGQGHAANVHGNGDGDGGDGSGGGGGGGQTSVLGELREAEEKGPATAAVGQKDGGFVGPAGDGVTAPARGRATRGSSCRTVRQQRSPDRVDSDVDGGGEAAAKGDGQEGAEGPRRAPRRGRRAAAAAAAAAAAVACGDDVLHRGPGGGDDGGKPKPRAKPPAKPRRKGGREEAPAAAAEPAAGEGGVGAGEEAAPTAAARRGRMAAAKAAAAAAVPRLAVLSPEDAAALRGEPLLDLGELVPGTLVRRPSASIKTPYVADVRLVPPPHDGHDPAVAGPEGRLVLAHAPALDCGGMVTPGCTVYLSHSAANRREGAPPTATSHAIQLVEDPRPGGGVAVVGSHPQLAERMAAEMLRRRCLEDVLGPYDAIETQRTYGNTRVDFVLRMADGSSTLLEVKNVVCADFPEGGVPPGRPKVGAYTVPVPPGGVYRPTALFPHGAQKPKIKVVSDRAIKHVWELTQLHKTGATGPSPSPAGLNADQDGSGPAPPHPPPQPPPPPPPPPQAGQPKLRSAVLFVVNRSDCTAFRPCHEADPLFARVLKAAQDAGVTLLAYDITWRGGQALLGKQLPVVFGEGVTGEYDPGRLAEVLQFNATDPRKNWKGAGGPGAGSPTARKKKTG